jgi:hypothetical protein
MINLILAEAEEVSVAFPPLNAIPLLLPYLIFARRELASP